MVHMYVEGDILVIELSKLEKLLSLKSRLVIPLSYVDVKYIKELSKDGRASAT